MRGSSIVCMLVALTALSRVGFAQPRTEPPTEPPAEPVSTEPEEPAKPAQPSAAPVEPDAEPIVPAHTMDELAIPKNRLRFGINIFGDVSYEATTPNRPHSSFSIGTLGVRFLGELSPSVDALAELAFETTDDGPLADIEQVALRWRAGRGVLEVGRFHTDLGYWNRAYHHGLWLQTPIARPHVLRFEDDGGLVPVHMVGAQYALELGPVTTVLALGNGRGDIVDDIRVATDTNDNKAVLLKIRYQLETLELGLGGIYDVIAPSSAAIRPRLPDESIRELIGNAYLVFRGDGPLVIGEGYVFRHDASTETRTTYSVYALVGYEATPFMPYVAFDFIDGADDDAFFNPDPAMATSFDLVELLAGVRFETSAWSALKVELRISQLRNQSTEDNEYTAAVNWSFGL